MTSCPCFVFTFNWFSSGHGSGHRVNRLSSIKFFYVSRGRLGGLHHFQPSFGRGVFFAWCRKLHYNYFKPSDVRHIDRSYTFIPLSCLYYRNFTSLIFAGFSRGYYYTTNRPKLKYLLLRSYRRRGPSLISTFVLVFWPSRSLYFNFTRIWFNFSYC